MSAWRTRSTKELYDYIQGNMPPGGAALTDDQFMSVAAFILQSNGAQAGANAFTATTAVPVGTIATGQRPAAPAARAAQADSQRTRRGPADAAGRPAARRRRGGHARAGRPCAARWTSGPAPRRGLTVAGSEELSP
jgi:hypothetical protein